MCKMIVHVDVSIPILGDESLMKITPPAGFTYRKLPLAEYEYRDRVIDGTGKVSFDFHYAVHDDNENITVLECSADEEVSCDSPANSIGFMLSDAFSTIAESIKEKYEQRLFRYFSMLRIYKEGEFARKYSFYRFRTSKGIINHDNKIETICADELTLIRYPMMILDSEIAEIDSFISDHDAAYTMLKNVIINDLVYSYHIIDDATVYKNLITPLEVLFLSGDYGAKKVMLAKRIAVLLEDDDAAIVSLYEKVRNHYVDRSEAVHEGVAASINRNSVDALRNLIRRVIKKEFSNIEAALATNPALTFDAFKAEEIMRLKQIVALKNGLGIFGDV